MEFKRKLEQKRATISFEFFPPKSRDGWATLYETIAATTRLEVDLVSVTYGAGGSTRENTVDLVASLQNNLALEAMAHLTCLGHSRGELVAILDRLTERGVPAIMALRGDPPKGESNFVAHPDGFGYASELIGFIREGWPHFMVGCAAYPEAHVEAVADGERSALEVDIGYLKLKQEMGAEFAMTQLFFDNQAYFDFVELAERAGVEIPLIPGIMPMSSPAQIERFVALSGCSIPEALREAAAADDVVASGYEFALEQCRQLLLGGAPGIHLYTLNQCEISGQLMGVLRGENLL